MLYALNKELQIICVCGMCKRKQLGRGLKCTPKTDLKLLLLPHKSYAKYEIFRDLRKV
jgi:hypothetical protein